MAPNRDIDRELRALHQQVVERYARQIDRSRRDEGMTEVEQANERAAATVRSIGTDMDLVARLEQDGEQALERFLAEVRPGLIDRPSLHSQDAKIRILHHSFARSSHLVVPAYASTLLAPDRTEIENNQGEQGGQSNWWIMPYDPSECKISRSTSGSGWGCGAYGMTPPATCVMWYTFVPDRSGLWTVNV